jgi:hypothetical protein
MIGNSSSRSGLARRMRYTPENQKVATKIRAMTGAAAR